jgi:mannosyltransferase
MNADRATSLRLAILAILLLSFIIRLAGLNAQSIWRDEADSLRFAGSPALLTQMLTEPGHNGPLYYVLLRGWLGLVGPGLTAARLFSALWGTLTVALVYAVGRRLFTVSVAALAALLAGVSPYLVWYSQEARMYAPALAVGLLALRLLLAALKRGGAGRWLIYVLSAGLSLYLHLAAALLIPVHILAGLLTRRRLIYLAALGLLLTAGPLLSWIIPFLLHPIVIGRAPARPADMFAGLLLALTAGPSGLFSLWTALPGLFLALAGAALAPAGERRPVGLALAWVLLPLAGLALLALRLPVFSERYLIFVAPAFCLLAARGVAALGARWRALAGLTLTATLVVCGAGLWAQLTQPIKPDFRSAAALYRAERQPGDIVLFLIPQAQGPFEELAPADGARYLAAPYAGRPAEAATVPAQLEALLADSRRVWLIESEVKTWDPDGICRRWLEQRYDIARRAELHLLRVTMYTRRVIGRL